MRKPIDENAFIVESRQVKNVVRVTAVDPHTGIEATIVTPLRVSQIQREKLAVRKLLYVLQKQYADKLEKENPHIQDYDELL